MKSDLIHLLDHVCGLNHFMVPHVCRSEHFMLFRNTIADDELVKVNFHKLVSNFERISFFYGIIFPTMVPEIILVY